MTDVEMEAETKRILAYLEIHFPTMLWIIVAANDHRGILYSAN